MEKKNTRYEPYQEKEDQNPNQVSFKNQLTSHSNIDIPTKE